MSEERATVRSKEKTQKKEKTPEVAPEVAPEDERTPEDLAVEEKAEKKKKPRPNCAVCGEIIDKVAVGALGKKFHIRCLVCAVCGEPFPTGEYIEIDGKLVCTGCNQSNCAVCKKKMKEFFVRDGKKIHPSCFKCASCNTSLEQGQFFTVDGKAHCEPCYRLTKAPRKIKGKGDKLEEVELCRGCGNEIKGPKLTIEGKKWHHECFRCRGCGKMISPTEKFYEVQMSKNAIGKQDYICEMCYQSFCIKCQNVIGPKEKYVTYHDQKIHNKCLTCLVCNLLLSADLFYARDGMLLCEAHYQAYERGLLKRK